MSKKFVLSICIPTYNRKEVLLEDIRRYLTLNDSRFCLKINDNCSSDGTFEDLCEILDPRVFCHQNLCNVGALRNIFECLSGVDSDFVLFLIDKNTIYENELPAFIDFLQEYRPPVGYVERDFQGDKYHICYPKGFDAVLFGGGYSVQHPSGYFFCTKYLEKELKKDLYSKLVPTFPFPIQLLVGAIACENNAYYVSCPLYCQRQNIEEIEKISLTYNKECKFYFNIDIALRNFEILAESLFSSSLPKDEKQRILHAMILKLIWQETVYLHEIYSSERLSRHYRLRRRLLPTRTMIYNALCVLIEYIKLSRQYKFVIPISDYIIVVRRAVGKVIQVFKTNVNKRFLCRNERGILI